MVFNLVQMSALGSVLREPNWWNLEEAERLIIVGGNGAGSLEYLKIGEKQVRFKGALPWRARRVQ